MNKAFWPTITSLLTIFESTCSLKNQSCWFDCSSIPWLVFHVSPKSDQHYISPCYIFALWNKGVLRIKDMITWGELCWYLNNVSVLLLWECIEGQKNENFNFNLGFAVKSNQTTTTTTTTTTNFIENWKITNYITFPPANSL